MPVMAVSAATMSTSSCPAVDDMRKLHASKADATDNGGGQDTLEGLESPHHHHKVSRNKHGNRSTQSADPGAEQLVIDAGDTCQCGDRNTDRTKGDGCRIGQQAYAGSKER